MKPLLKWAGGKRHIAEELFSYFPSDWNKGVYFEPFFGGGAVFLHIKPENAIISDFNAKLTNFYEQVKNDVDFLYESILEIATNFDSQENENKTAYFMSLRRRFNENQNNDIESASLLYALNKLCFNGLYRENSKGFFNVPFGQKKKFPEVTKNDFLEVSELLQKTQIKTADFADVLALAESGDFVYLDPPYIPIDATSSFTSYHAEGFSLKDQERLSALMTELQNRSIRAICSNSDTEITRNIYGSHKLNMINAPRMVGAKSSSRGLISELVITNF